jgi:S1-C subfamily serine protease
MKRLTAVICLTIAVLLGSVGMASALPPCPGDYDRSTWTNCFGTYTYASGNKYVGEFRNGWKNGKGTSTWAKSGSKYVGEYRNGKRNGQFTVTYASGNKYVGEYRNDQRNGQFTVTYASGNKYVGEYRNGKRNGQGTYTGANGDKYVGEFRDGKSHGQGTETFASGSKYVGEFRNDKRNGQGTYTFANGEKYVGEYRNGKRNGQGTVTLTDGRTKEGVWKAGKFQYAQKVTPPVIAKRRPPRVTKPAPTYANLSDPRLCKKALDRSRKSWDRSRKYRLYSNAAKRRGLTIKYCRLVLGISKPKAPVRVAKPVRKTKPNKVISASSGSGFAVSSDGYVVTNHHVIKGCQKVKIHDKGKSIAATVVTYDPRNDLALLKGNFRPSAVLSLSADSPEILQDVFVAGYPFGRRVSRSIKVTRGIISSLTGIGNNFSQIQIDAALQPGNSGGPILDDRGNVVGVAVSRLDKIKALKKFGSLPENTNFGVKTSVVRSILESSNVTIPRPNGSSISKSKLGKMISGGTYYLSCWMTTAQIEKMRSKKVIFQNLD